MPIPLEWDNVGERFYETGVDRGVLYVPTAGVYNTGFAWNGLTSVSESPSGAEPNAQYADNIKYLNLFSAEEFTCTIEAFTYPAEFNQFDGLSTPAAGVLVGQQARTSFGLSYRTSSTAARPARLKRRTTPLMTRPRRLRSAGKSQLFRPQSRAHAPRRSLRSTRPRLTRPRLPLSKHCSTERLLLSLRCRRRTKSSP